MEILKLHIGLFGQSVLITHCYNDTCKVLAVVSPTWQVLRAR